LNESSLTFIGNRVDLAGKCIPLMMLPDQGWMSNSASSFESFADLPINKLYEQEEFVRKTTL
jgi:hypothetical protein